MGSPNNFVQQTVDRLISLSTIIGTLALLFAVTAILIDVVGRFFGSPLTGSRDLSQMAMVIIVFGGVALCDKEGGNIAVDIFEPNFSERFNYWLDIVGWVIGALIFIAIGYTVLEGAAIAKMLNLSTNVIGLPKAPFQYALCAFAFLTAAAMLIRTITTLLVPGVQRRTTREEEL